MWGRVASGCVLAGLGILYLKPEIQRWFSTRVSLKDSETALTPTDEGNNNIPEQTRTVKFALDQTEFYSPRPSVATPADAGLVDLRDEGPQRLKDPREDNVDADRGEPIEMGKFIEAIQSGRQVNFLEEELNRLVRQLGAPEVGKFQDKSTGRTVLHECASHLAAGQERLVEVILKRSTEFDLSVDAPDQSSGGMTALQLACAIGKEKIAEAFILSSSEASLLKTNPAGWSCIHFMVARERPNLLEKLIKRVREFEDKTVATKIFNLAVPSVGTAVCIGLKAKAAQCCLMLLDQFQSGLVDLGASEGQLPHIHLSVSNGFTFYAVTSKIIECDPHSVNYTDRDGRTPLHVALQHGHGRVSLLLVANGANPFVGDVTNGVTPLHLVASSNDLGLLEVLLDKTKGSPHRNLEVSDVAGRTPLIAACIHGSHKTARALLLAGARVESKGNDEASALHWALKNKRKDASLTLLEFQAPLNFKDSHGNTPLMIACYNGKTFASVAEMILDRNPRLLHDPDSEGRYPIHWVAAHGHSQLCTALLDAGASSMVATKVEGIFPMHWAAQQAQYDTVEMLYHDGVNVQEISEQRVIDVEDAAGRTPLHWLCQRLSDDEIRSSTYTQSSEDFEPLSMMQAQRVLKFLLDHGADPSKPIREKDDESSARSILSRAGLQDLLPEAESANVDSAFASEEPGFGAFGETVESKGDAFGAETFSTNVHHSEQKPAQSGSRRRGTTIGFSDFAK